MRLRILNHLMVPFCRYRTIARLSGSFVMSKTFERERVRDLWRVQGEDLRGVGKADQQAARDLWRLMG